MQKIPENKLCKSAALPYVEMRSAYHSSNCYSTHSHDEFSFGVVDYGLSEYKNTGSNYFISAGTTVTINPGDAHSCNPREIEWSYRMLFVDSHWLGQLQQEFSGKYANDYIAFEQHLINRADYYQLFSALYCDLLAETNVLQAEGLLIGYCAKLFEISASPKETLFCNLSIMRLFA